MGKKVFIGVSSFEINCDADLLFIPPEFLISRETSLKGDSSAMNSNKNKRQSSKVLTRTEARILEAIAERIFPKTDMSGAVEAGALDYINLALAGDYAKLLPLYRRGLRAVDRHARRKLGAKIMNLEDEQKDVILADFAAR